MPLNANAHARIINGLARMDVTSWNALTSDDKTAWDAVSEKGKATILAILDDPNKNQPAIDTTTRAPPRRNPQPFRRPPPQRSLTAKQHEMMDLNAISAADFFAMTHAISHDSEGNVDDDDPTATNTDISSLSDDLAGLQGALGAFAHSLDKAKKLLEESGILRDQTRE